MQLGGRHRLQQDRDELVSVALSRPSVHSKPSIPGLLLVFYITFLFLIYGLCVSMVVVAVTAIDYFTNGTLYNVSEIINPMHP